jgi:hypothetical protein
MKQRSFATDNVKFVEIDEPVHVLADLKGFVAFGFVNLKNFFCK